MPYARYQWQALLYSSNSRTTVSLKFRYSCKKNDCIKMNKKYILDLRSLHHHTYSIILNNSFKLSRWSPNIITIFVNYDIKKCLHLHNVHDEHINTYIFCYRTEMALN